MDWPTARKAALARDEGLCRRCSRPASHVHHRLRKGMGGELDENVKYGLANLVSLCAECHRHIHDHPAESYEAGWLLHTWQVPEENPPPEMRTYEF